MPLSNITVASLGDLSNNTLPELNRGEITEIASKFQKYIVMPELLRKGNTITYTSGKSFQWQVMVNGSGTAANVGLAYQDKTSIVDTTVSASADWRNSKVDWAVIGQEVQMNMPPARIVSVEMLREAASMLSVIELMEGNWFGPPVASTDLLTPWGMRTWFTKNSSEGFNGAAPSGYTAIGLDPAVYDQWKNYTFPYTAVDDTDFVRKVNRAVEFTDWKTPLDMIPQLKKGMAYRMFSNYGLIGPLQELLKASNDNLGVDIGRYAGAVVIHRVPLQRIPALEIDTTNPIYGLAMGSIKLGRLKDWWNRPTHIDKVPGHHTVSADYRDFTYQFYATNRRDTFVGSNGTSEPG